MTTPQDIIGLLRAEGLHDAIRSYIEPDRITDPVLAQAWRDARQAIMVVERLLEREGWGG